MKLILDHGSSEEITIEKEGTLYLAKGYQINEYITAHSVQKDLKRLNFTPEWLKNKVATYLSSHSDIEISLLKYEQHKALGKVNVINTLNTTQVSDKSNFVPHSTNNQDFIPQYDSFEFDGFRWRILSVHRLSAIGRENNLQHPKNDSFIVIEASLQNISKKTRYYGDFKLLTNTGGQYSDSTKVSVYGKYYFNYDCKDSTKFEPNSNLKTFFGFDAKFSKSYTLLIEKWGSGKGRKKVKIDHIRSY